MAEANKFAIHEAAREGKSSASIVESLLNSNPRLATRRDDDDRLALHWALSYNHPAIVELLVQTRDFDVDAKDGSGWTPLMIASNIKDGEALVELLLSKGADVNAKNTAGQTCLHFCASKAHVDIARQLISKGATARVKDRRGQLALHRAAAVGSVPMIKLLLENRSPVNATDDASQTALHHAIAEGHGDAAVELLRAGAATDKRDVDDHVAIDLAPDDKVRSFVLRQAEEEGITM